MADNPAEIVFSLETGMSTKTFILLCLIPALTLPVEAAGAADAPLAPPESWLFVQTESGQWAVRVDGGPKRQVEVKSPPEMRSYSPKMLFLRELGFQGDEAPPGKTGWEIEGGKRFVYTERMPGTVGRGKEPGGAQNRLVVSEPKGKNPVILITGLCQYEHHFALTPDGKAVLCVAEKDGDWGVYRVPYDGSKPIRLNRITTKQTLSNGHGGITFRQLGDGRIVYWVYTHDQVEPVVIQGVSAGTVSFPSGTAILSDGKTEKVLVKDMRMGLPIISDDGSKLAEVVEPEGKSTIVVTDLKTDKTERFPITAFNKNWKCGFGILRFRADGKALAVSFFLPDSVLHNLGPVPGHETRNPAGVTWIEKEEPLPVSASDKEAMKHVAVIWFDGRMQRISLFQIDQPRLPGVIFPSVQRIEWSPRPAIKE